MQQTAIDDPTTPPKGFVRLRSGVNCRCFNMWTDGIDVWCCNANRYGQSETIDAYAVFDSEKGLIFCTISKSPVKAIEKIPEHNDLNRQFARMIGGQIKVRQLRIEILGEIDPCRIETSPQDEKKTQHGG